MNRLTLTYAAEDQWHGELFAEVQSEEFTGRGSAWFSLEHLETFAASLDAYPLPDDDPPNLEGGYIANVGSELLELHLGLRISAYDRRGNLRVRVILATGDGEDRETVFDQSVTARFLVTYEDFGRFRRQLAALLAGQATEAVLQSTF